MDGFVAAAGTGGTLAGCTAYLRSKNPRLRSYLIDPPGSGLLSYVKDGVFCSEGSCFIDGIGIMRLTANFKVSCGEAIRM